jgi:hypothetical protein
MIVSRPPRPAAEAFMMGHVQIPLAIVFGQIRSPFLRRLQGAILWGTERIIKPDWRKVSGPEQVQDAVRCMLHPEEYAPREENHATAYQ